MFRLGIKKDIAFLMNARPLERRLVGLKTHVPDQLSWAYLQELSVSEPCSRGTLRGILPLHELPQVGVALLAQSEALAGHFIMVKCTMALLV